MNLSRRSVRRIDRRGLYTRVAKSLYVIGRLKVIDAAHAGRNIAGDRENGCVVVARFVKTRQQMSGSRSGRPRAYPESAREFGWTRGGKCCG